MNFFRKYSGYFGFGFLLLGMIVGAIGWDKYESTLPIRTQGSVLLIILGIAMIIGGLVIIKVNTKKER
jgi:sulfite exporter TauE/SafE